MSREVDQIAALREGLARAESSFELSRCHFEAHALLRKFPGSVEGRLLLEQIERAMRERGTEAGEPTRAEPPSVWKAAMRPLPWALGLILFAYLVLYFLRRYLR